MKGDFRIQGMLTIGDDPFDTGTGTLHGEQYNGIRLVQILNISTDLHGPILEA